MKLFSPMSCGGMRNQLVTSRLMVYYPNSQVWGVDSHVDRILYDESQYIMDCVQVDWISWISVHHPTSLLTIYISVTSLCIVFIAACTIQSSVSSFHTRHIIFQFYIISLSNHINL